MRCKVGKSGTTSLFAQASGTRLAGYTDIDFPDMSFECCDRRYLAKTMPAGHSCPPQPFLRSSFNNKGSWRSPSNVVVVVPAVLMSRGGANESLTLNGASGSDSGLGDLSMDSFVFRLRNERMVQIATQFETPDPLEASKKQKVEKRRGAPISSRAGLFRLIVRIT